MKNQIESLKEIETYNKNLLNQAEGEINKVINEMITFRYKGYDIWDPFKDETSRSEVDPLKKYGSENIEKMINDFNRLK
jgi:hypothetical protein